MNEECPICYEIIDSKDVEGLICFTCNHFYCKVCSFKIYTNFNNKCSICNDSLKLEEKEELFKLINITLNRRKEDYLHLGLVYYKIAEKYFAINFKYSINYYEYTESLGLEIPVLKIADKYFNLDEYQNALKWYQKLPDNGIACSQVASIEIILNNYKRGIEKFKKSASLGNYNALSSLGNIYYKQKNYKKAKDWFQLGTSLKDENSIINLAVYYINIEDNKSEFIKLLKPLSKKNRVAMFNLSVVYLKMNYFYSGYKFLHRSAKLKYHPAIELLIKLNG